MFFDSFSSKSLQNGMDAMWMKMQIHADNVANYETPGYKAKRLTFSQVMQRTQNGAQQPVLQTNVITDTTTTARADGNNVVMENEQMELWKAQAQYAYAVQKVNEEYTNLRTIITQVGR